ncbi:uncharacterized protein METZ01_LOCUS361287, partial [marine metagenome]
IENRAMWADEEEEWKAIEEKEKVTDNA